MKELCRDEILVVTGGCSDPYLFDECIEAITTLFDMNVIAPFVVGFGVAYLLLQYAWQNT